MPLEDPVLPGDLVCLELWACELEAEHRLGSADAASRACTLRRVLAACRDESLSKVLPTSSSARIQPSEFTFPASPKVLRAGHATVLSTEVVRYLKRKGLIAWLLVVLSLVLLFVTLVEPFSDFIPRDGGRLRWTLPDGSVSELRVKREGLFTWLVEDTVAPVLWFLMLHYVNRDIAVQAFCTFDSLMIFGSFVLSEATLCWNMTHVWGSKGLYDNTWFVFDGLHALLVVFPVGFMISTMDSWKVHTMSKGSLNKIKITLTALACVYFMFSILDNQAGVGRERWPDESECVVGALCVLPRKIFMQSEFQKVIFLSHALYTYCSGKPFAFINPIYISSIQDVEAPSSQRTDQTLSSQRTDETLSTDSEDSTDGALSD